MLPFHPVLIKLKEYFNQAAKKGMLLFYSSLNYKITVYKWTPSEVSISF